MPPDPPLTSPRLSLRQFRTHDAEAIARSCRDPEIGRFTMMPDAMNEVQARDWIEQGLAWWPMGIARFAVTVPPSDECVGQIGVQFDFNARRAEAFYWLDPQARRNGLATEALALVTQWVFDDFDIERVQLVTFVENDASQRVAERCGFVHEGVLRSWEPVKGAQPDVVMFSRVRSHPRDPEGVPSRS